MKRTFFAKNAFLILWALVFCLPFIWVGSRRALLKNQNDVKTWLPQGFKETDEYSWFKDHFPHDQFILASWEGCTLDDPRLDFFASQLRGIMARQAEEYETGETSQMPYFKSVLTGKELVDQTEERFTNLSREQVLDRLAGSLIGEDHHKTCLVVTLSDAFHGVELAAVIQTVKNAANNSGVLGDRKTFKGRRVPTAELHLGGPPVDNAAIDYEGKRTLIRLAGWSAVIGLGISWVCFRSIRLTAMIFSCAILAAGVGLSIVFFSDGLVDAILLSMPSLVYVLAMSGAIHIINYYHDAVHEGGLENAPERALSHGWKPCGLAAVTTAIGLASLCNSNLIPVYNFGLYAAAGVLATLVLIFLVLPAWLSLWPSREFAEKLSQARKDPNERATKRHTIFHRVWHVIGGKVIRHNGLVAAGCVGVMIFFAFGMRWIDPSIQLMKLFSPGTRILVDYEWLEGHLGPLMAMEVVIRVDKDTTMTFAQRMRLARDVESAIETLEPVGGAISAATFAPDLGRRRFKVGGLSGQKERFFSKELEAHREAFAEGGYLQVDKETGEELWRVSARVQALSDLDYGEFVDELRAVVEPIHEFYAARGATGISVTYTGLVPLVYKAQTELFTGLFNSLVMAFVLIAFVMMLVLRSFSAGLISMVPNLFPVVVIFGAMGWLGILVDVGSMMTASVALGVAVDDTIHYLTWFRHGLDMGHSRKRAAMMAYQRCATAMSQTTLIGGLGLAVFALSTFTPTQRFGYIMLTLLFTALVGDLIFLPALLTGPFGRFFDRRRGKSDGGDEGRPRDDWSSPKTRPARHRLDEQTTISDLPSKKDGEPVAPRRDKPSPLPTPHGHLAKPRRIVKE